MKILAAVLLAKLLSNCNYIKHHLFLASVFSYSLQVCVCFPQPAPGCLLLAVLAVLAVHSKVFLAPTSCIVSDSCALDLQLTRSNKT